MSIFSLDWFKSTKKKELEALKVEEQKLKIKLLEQKLSKQERPYLKYKLVNDVLTVVLPEGDIISKANATIEDVNRLKLATTVLDVKEILFTTHQDDDRLKKELNIDVEEKLVKQVVENTSVLEKYSDFVKKENSYYFREIDRSIPALLLTKIIQVLKTHDDNLPLEKNEEYMSLKRFFMWCCLNPRAEVADELYGFLMKNSFRITKQGMFVALRNVVTVKEKHVDRDLLDFVTNAHVKVRTVWKQKPKNFTVYERLGEYKLVERIAKAPKGDNPSWKEVGNLDDLFKNVPEMDANRFTDDYTRTFDIRVGRVVSMPPEECNWSTADCAHAGLHFTANEIHYVGCGDTSVLILINPMKVVGIGSAKGRCYEYFPIMTVPRMEATQILHDLDFDTLQLDDDYALAQLTDLQEQAKNGFVAETKKYEYNLPKISTKDMKNMIDVLSKMKDDIRGRVQKAL